jgi:hypothetical protein
VKSLGRSEITAFPLVIAHRRYAGRLIPSH